MLRSQQQQGVDRILWSMVGRVKERKVRRVWESIKMVRVWLTLHSADVQVEVFAKSAIVIIGVDVLTPAVKELVQVVEIILTSAAARVARSSGLGDRQSACPAIVLPNTQE